MHLRRVRPTSLPRGAAAILLAGLATACDPGRAERATREQAIHRAILDSLARADSASHFVMRPLTADPLLWLSHRSSGAVPDSGAALRYLSELGIERELAVDFVAANAARDSLLLPRDLQVRLSLDTLPPLTPAERDAVWRRGGVGTGFERFRDAYPGARHRLALSHAGLSPDGAQAVVYVEVDCGLLCGGGTMLRLERMGEHWRIVESIPLWAT